MIKFENTDTYGWGAAVRGMRNPKNSWDRSDSEFDIITRGIGDLSDDYNPVSIGPKDMALMKSLNSGGPVHAKYRRMITVTVDITAPLYWWKEFDTYKVGTVANGCSTMHKIHDKEFTLEDFSCEHLTEFVPGQRLNGWTFEDNDMITLDHDPDYGYSSMGILTIVIKSLNFNRNKFVEIQEHLKNDMSIEDRQKLQKQAKKYWWQMIQLLPSSYNQKRTVQLNYEVLVGIYKWRKDHKLDEWHDFCHWIESLPYSELITGPEFFRKEMIVSNGNGTKIRSVTIDEIRENHTEGEKEL